MAGPQPAPLASQFGPLVAGLLAELHTERGVRLRLGTAVDRLAGHREARSPACDWTPARCCPPTWSWSRSAPTRRPTGSRAADCDVDNGVVCDSRCRAAEGIYAVGDVARWHHDGLGALLRLENRTNATEQAVAVAANILGDGPALQARARTSGPTSSTPGSRCTGCRPPRPR